MEDRMLSDEILLGLIKKAGGDVSKVEAEVAAIKDGTIIDSFADVENALADKTDDDAVAPEFDNNMAYSAGSLVYHDGTLYKFDSDHAAGAWDASEVSPTTVAAEFNQLKNTLIDVDSKIDDITEYPYAPSITIEDAVPANLAECKVKIEPVQSGSGDPSPTNVRPITGHTEASVQVTDGDETTKTYTIALGDTIYGGTVRIDRNGNTVMDVDRAERVFDGSEDEQWSEYIGTNYHQYNLTISDSVDKWYMSNLLQIITVDEREVKSGIAKKTSNFDNLLRVCFLDTEYSITSLADFKTWIASNPLQVCYELATPTTIQLTPQQIQLLKGTNTLTASTGDISVTVNGVSGAIGQVQEQVNELAEQLPTAPTTNGAYVLTVTVADGTPTYSWESAS